MAFYGFNDIASHVWRTCLLPRYVSQHPTPCKLGHNSSPERAIGQCKLLRANKKHINFDYAVGQKVLKYDKTIMGKLKPKTTGPFEILRVHSNGTVTIG
ncbi:hypothetical protein ACHAXS_009634 [Conticribra weissflogii]